MAEDLGTRIRTIVVEQLGVEPSEVTPECQHPRRPRCGFARRGRARDGPRGRVRHRGARRGRREHPNRSATWSATSPSTPPSLTVYGAGGAGAYGFARLRLAARFACDLRLARRAQARQHAGPDCQTGRRRRSRHRDPQPPAAAPGRRRRRRLLLLRSGFGDGLEDLEERGRHHAGSRGRRSRRSRASSA